MSFIDEIKNAAKTNDQIDELKKDVQIYMDDLCYSIASQTIYDAKKGLLSKAKAGEFVINPITKQKTANITVSINMRDFIHQEYTKGGHYCKQLQKNFDDLKFQCKQLGEVYLMHIEDKPIFMKSRKYTKRNFIFQKQYEEVTFELIPIVKITLNKLLQKASNEELEVKDIYIKTNFPYYGYFLIDKKKLCDSQKIKIHFNNTLTTNAKITYALKTIRKQCFNYLEKIDGAPLSIEPTSYDYSDPFIFCMFSIVI